MTDRQAGGRGDLSRGSRTAGKGTATPVRLSADSRSLVNLALFVAGPLIWTSHFLIVYLVAEAGCSGDGGGLNLFDPPVPTTVTLAATAVGAIASLVTARWSYRRWRGTRKETSENGTDLHLTDGAALAFGGYLLSLLAFIVVLFVGLPALVVPACAP